MIDKKKYKITKTIEYFYNRNGDIQKENHYDYDGSSISRSSYVYENIGERRYREIDLSNGIVRSIVDYNEHGEVVARYINNKKVYDIEIKYGDHGITYKRNNNREWYYNYNTEGVLWNIQVHINSLYEYSISVQQFGNTIVYLVDGDIHKIEIYDDNGNLIYDIYKNLYMKKEYNRKGLVTKLEVYSSIDL